MSQDEELPLDDEMNRLIEALGEPAYNDGWQERLWARVEERQQNAVQLGQGDVAESIFSNSDETKVVALPTRSTTPRSRSILLRAAAALVLIAGSVVVFNSLRADAPNAVETTDDAERQSGDNTTQEPPPESVPETPEEEEFTIDDLQNPPGDDGPPAELGFSSSPQAYIGQGPPGPSGFWFSTVVIAQPNTSVKLDCNDSVDEAFFSVTVTTDDFGIYFTDQLCYSADPGSFWVTASVLDSGETAVVTESNQVFWTSERNDDADAIRPQLIDTTGTLITQRVLASSDSGSETSFLSIRTQECADAVAEVVPLFVQPEAALVVEANFEVVSREEVCTSRASLSDPVTGGVLEPGVYQVTVTTSSEDIEVVTSSVVEFWTLESAAIMFPDQDGLISSDPLQIQCSDLPVLANADPSGTDFEQLRWTLTNLDGQGVVPRSLAATSQVVLPVNVPAGRYAVSVSAASVEWGQTRRLFGRVEFEIVASATNPCDYANEPAPLEIVGFLGPEEVTCGDSFDLTPIILGEPRVFTWLPGLLGSTGRGDTAPLPLATYSLVAVGEPGSYPVSLTVVDDEGNADTAVFTVTVLC